MNQKNLVLDLKSELDAARTEISRMKSAGLGESVETSKQFLNSKRHLVQSGFCRKA